MRAGVVRRDHAQQPIGGHADRHAVLPARQPAGGGNGLTRRQLFQVTEPRMERWHSSGVSRLAGAGGVNSRQATLKYL